MTSTFNIGTIQGSTEAKTFTASFSILATPTEDVYTLFTSNLNDGFEHFQYDKNSIVIYQSIPIRSVQLVERATSNTEYNLYIGRATDTKSRSVHVTLIATSTQEAQELLAAQQFKLTTLDTTLVIENVRTEEDGTRKVKKLKPRILEQVVFDAQTSSVFVQQLLTPNNFSVHSFPYKLFVMD
jgi:hypothetical protein